MRAQLRMPLWKQLRSNFSLGECTRSSSSAKPTSSESMPSTFLKSATMGIEPPAPTATALWPHSSASTLRALLSAGIVERQLQRRRQAEIAELDLAVGRQPRAHEGAEAVAHLLRVLLADQAERDLRRGLARDDGLGALAGIAADDAVDLGGRPRGDLLEHQAALLAGRDLEADLAEEFLRRQVERLAGRP